MTLDTTIDRAAEVGLVGFVGGQIRQGLDLVLEVDVVDVSVQGELAGVPDRAGLIAGRLLRHHRLGERRVHVEGRDVRHQEPLRILSVDREVGLNAIVGRQVGQGLGVGVLGKGGLDGTLHRQSRGVHIKLEVHILHAGGDGQVFQGAPLELSEALILMPAGIFVVGDVERHLAGAVIGLARSDLHGPAVTARRAGEQGRHFAIVRLTGQQVDIKAVALGLGDFVHAADGQRAEVEVLGRLEGVAAHPVFVALQVALQARAGHGVALAADGVRRRRRQEHQLLLRDVCRCGRVGAVVVRRQGLVGVPVAVERVFDGQAAAQIAIESQVLKVRLLLRVVVVLEGRIGRVIAQRETLAVGFRLGDGRGGAGVALIVVVVIAGEQEGRRPLRGDRQGRLDELILTGARAVGQVTIRLVFHEVCHDVQIVEVFHRAGGQSGHALDGAEATRGQRLADRELVFEGQGEQVQRAAEAGLAEVRRRARAAVDDDAADGRVREEGVGVVARAVGVAPGDTVVRDVEFTVLETAHRDLGAVRGARAVRVRHAGHRRGEHRRRREVAHARRGFFDELAGDHGLRLGRLQGRLHRRGVRRLADWSGDLHRFDFRRISVRRGGAIGGVRDRQGQRRRGDADNEARRQFRRKAARIHDVTAP